MRGRAEAWRWAAAIGASIAMTLAMTVPVTLANSMSDGISAPPVTQTHTLFYNLVSCPGGKTGYAFVRWSTRFQRTAGADREFGKVRSIVESHGRSCDGRSDVNLSTGIQTYYPRFGSSNDITWGATLNWATTVPDFPAAGSSAKGTYMYRTGHPGSVAQVLCNDIDLFGIQFYDACPQL
jgi:hypothetical protein